MTRLFLYIIAALILLNAAVFMWPDKVNSAPHIYAAKSDVNPHFVRLNKEIEARFYSQPIEEITDSVDSGAIVGANASAVLPSTANQEVGSENCYRVGPFMHQANYELAQAVLFNADVGYKKSKRASKASNVFRIYLGPFDTQVEVDNARIELRRNKILDHFVRKQGDDSLMISLGIYSTAETAETALRLFRNKIADVKQRSENVVLPDSYWLHFEVIEDDRMLQQLRVIDWGEPSAKMGLFGCLGQPVNRLGIKVFEKHHFLTVFFKRIVVFQINYT